VITCPEAFSLLVSNGMPFDYLGAVEGMDNVVQDTVMDMQIGLEDSENIVMIHLYDRCMLFCEQAYHLNS